MLLNGASLIMKQNMITRTHTTSFESIAWKFGKSPQAANEHLDSIDKERIACREARPDEYEHPQSDLVRPTSGQLIHDYPHPTDTEMPWVAGQQELEFQGSLEYCVETGAEYRRPFTIVDCNPADVMPLAREILTKTALENFKKYYFRSRDDEEE